MNEFNYRWNEEKDNLLKKSRDISFEDILLAIDNQMVLDITNNPSSNFDNQKCFIINVDNYAYVVPFVKNGDEIFLKTIFPSRKYTKYYNLKG